MKLLLSGTHETICEKISVGFMFLIFNYVFLHFFFKFRAFTPHHRLLTLFLKSHNRYYTAIVKLATLAPAVKSPAPSYWKKLPYTHHIMGSEHA